jgi:transcriptional regulator with XRE-family HTH domain
MFGKHVRKVRENLKEKDKSFSVRQVARRIGVEPAYLSKVEREEVSPPSEGKIRRLALELGEDPDVLLSMAGKVSSDLLEIIRRRPQTFAQLLRSLGEASDRTLKGMLRGSVRKR